MKLIWMYYSLPKWEISCLLKWSCWSSPMCWLLNLRWLPYFDCAIQSLLDTCLSDIHSWGHTKPLTPHIEVFDSYNRVGHVYLNSSGKKRLWSFLNIKVRDPIVGNFNSMTILAIESYEQLSHLVNNCKSLICWSQVHN